MFTLMDSIPTKLSKFVYPNKSKTRNIAWVYWESRYKAYPRKDYDLLVAALDTLRNVRLLISLLSFDATNPVDPCRVTQSLRPKGRVEALATVVPIYF